MFGLFKKNLGSDMDSLPRKNSEFLAMYRKDIEEIIKPYGFEYENRIDYYSSAFFPSEEWMKDEYLFFTSMPYGKAYIRISSNGRLSKFNTYAYFYPAIQELANIERHVYGDVGMRDTDNLHQWCEGVGRPLDLFSNTHVMRDNERYQTTLKNISQNLSKYMNLTTPREIFEIWLNQPNFYDDGTKNDKSIFFTFSNASGYRLGYLLILIKLAGEDYYQRFSEEFVTLNGKKIKERYNVDITKLKEFLDTYTVGSLA